MQRRCRLTYALTEKGLRLECQYPAIHRSGLTYALTEKGLRRNEKEPH